MPFFGYNRPGATISKGVRDNFWLAGHARLASRASTTPSRPSQKPTSPKTSRRSTSPSSSFTAKTTRSSPSTPRADLRQNPKKRQTENLSRLPSRHAHHPRRRHQRRPAGLHQILTFESGAPCPSHLGTWALTHPKCSAAPFQISTELFPKSGIFSAPRNHHPKTTFPPAIHHNFTTKNHHETTTFLKNPL